jgi:ubiquitin carboxyl-terminal hydrolase 34
VLRDIFIDFGRLTSRLIQLDLDRISTYADDAKIIDDLYSRQYVQAVAWTVQQTEIPLYIFFTRTRVLNVTAFIYSIVDKLVRKDEANILGQLAHLTVALKPILPKKVGLGTHLLHMVRAATQIIQSKSDYEVSLNVLNTRDPSTVDNVTIGSFDFFTKADDVMQNAIAKQQTWLTIENTPEFLRNFTLVYLILGAQIDGMGTNLVQTSGVESEAFTDEDCQSLTSVAWKVKTMRKLIVNGRMELRVWGMQEIQQELVTIYNNHVKYKPNCLTDPVVRFLVAFIRDTKLIAYIIGVDSHPQLISRSANVVGFLTMTGTYEDHDTDLMWHTVIESEDPRIVKEVLRVLSATAGLSELPALLHFCTTLLELPVERYDPHLVFYATEILDKIHQKLGQLGQLGQIEPDSRPLQVCIHLLRNASAPGACSIDLVQQIRHEIQTRFSNLLSRCGGQQEKELLWSQCIADITADNEFATGSIEAVRTWSNWAANNNQMLAVQSDLTSILVENIVHFAASCAQTDDRNWFTMQTAFEVRLSMLARLILNQPETMTRDLFDSVWDGVLTSPSLPMFIYTIAWNTLSSVIQGVGLTNPVIAFLVKDYLPRLQAKDFSQPCLTCLKHAMECQLNLKIEEPPGTAEVVDLPGADLIERVMLEAYPNTVEFDAADFLISKYLDHDLIVKRSSNNVKATHSALVDRCVREVIVAASLLKTCTDGTTSGEDEPMIMVASEDEIRAAEMRFYRWLLFLKKFLEGMKGRPSYSPKMKQPMSPGDAFERKGEAMEGSFQIYKSQHNDSSMRKISLGRDNTAAELWQYLSEVTGFESFRTISGGRDIELKDIEKTLDEIKFQAGNIIIIRHDDSPEKKPNRAIRASSPVDATVMDNFSELYALLDLDERLAREIFGFLSLFPAQLAVVDIIRSLNATPEELLPIEKPYRLLYCAQALRSCLETESFSPNPDSELLRYGVTTITSVLPQIKNATMAKDLQNTITKSLFEGLLLALRAKVPREVSQSYFKDPGSYVTQLLELLEAAANDEVTKEISQIPLFEPFEALLEGALHEEQVWPHITTELKSTALMRQILLVDTRPHVRKQFCKILLQLSGAGSTKLVLKLNDPRAARSRFSEERVESALAHVWAIIADELQYVEQYSSQSQELFDAAIAVFRRSSRNLSSGVLGDLFRRWSGILILHQHSEVVGRPSHDYVIPGFAKLLQECCKLLRAADAEFDTSDLSALVLSKFLLPFAKRSESDQQNIMPVLNGNVRGELYDLMLLINNDMASLPQLLESLNDTVLKDCLDSHSFNDRFALRSDVGYAGLRNLANTCYLNSFFSQLFMNVGFREMMIHASIVDETKQPLLLELGKVFSSMQNSYSKHVDPSAAVGSIVNYDNDQIDVAIQMDVDEFYNLLFDRLEWQFLVPAERDALKSHYGGQLVQQIKSKDCDHISETFENFTTVQLEIKGRRGLEDSLRAYVEGEILQGDNKYKCSQCDRHVDAVKRACLKDVPSNLIFNLKRFDYDIMTGMRAKVNDEFEFPETVDMAPYTTDYMTQPETASQPDMFELVGVIVHTGTADSGHYYSFTRQRPSSKQKCDSWVQFNDSEVNTFDLDTLRENCFGGISDFGFPKIYNAYMLFYERTSSIQKLEETFANADPVRIPLQLDIEQEIVTENKKCLQFHCIQDPSHAKFLRRILDRIRLNEDGDCSDSHEVEADVLIKCLDYVQHMSSRWKEQPEADSTLSRIQQYMVHCPKCAYVVLKWATENEVLRDRIIRSPYVNTRHGFKVLLFEAIRSLREWYTLPTEEQVNLVPLWLGDQAPLALFEDFVETVGRQWDHLPRFARAWEDYFELLLGVVKLGSCELLKFLESGILEKLLEIVLAHVGQIRPSLKEKVKVFATFRDKGRQFGLKFMLELLATLLDQLDITAITDEPRESMPDGFLPVNSFEAKLLGTMPENTSKVRLEWLKKAILGRQNAAATTGIVVKLAKSRRTAPLVQSVLSDGVNDQEVASATYFLIPTLTFCQFCPDERFVKEMLDEVLTAMNSIGTQYHREHLDLVLRLLRAENPKIEWDSRDFRKATIAMVSKWAPPLLLSPPTTRDNVSEETCDILKQYLWGTWSNEHNRLEVRNQALRNIKRVTVDGAKYVRENVLANSKDRINLHPNQADEMLRVLKAGLEVMTETMSDTAQGEEQIARISETIDLLQERQDAANTVETIGSPEWLGTSESDGYNEAASDAGGSTMLTPSPPLHDA